MSREASLVEPAILITIIGESVLKESIIQMLKSFDISGYTLNQVQGEGSHGKRMGDISGYNTNIEIKTIVPKEVSDEIFTILKEHKGRHAFIAFRQQVEALQ